MKRQAARYQVECNEAHMDVWRPRTFDHFEAARAFADLTPPLAGAARWSECEDRHMLRAGTTQQVRPVAA